MALCGLENVRHRIIKNLSKGYQQRLTLAQALINKPEVLILDEPTVGLDPENVSEIRNLIKSLSGDRTIILSSHILSEVNMVCSNVMIMNKGRIIAKDTPTNLGVLLQERQIVDVQIQGPVDQIRESLEMIPGVINAQRLETLSADMPRYRLEFNVGQDIYPELNALVYRKGWILREIIPIKMTLEEIFFKMLSAEEARLK
jgi:ABC-2 type transport system ATP-binding protein